MNFKVTQAEKVAHIDELLKLYLPQKTGLQKVVIDAMEYSVMAGGKRIRPMLMQEMYKMYGGRGKEITCFMAAIEFIHTYSLVHDDLPAMDDDDYRRGRKTTHVVYGEDMGILTGDALLNYAFETASMAFGIAPQRSLQIGQALQILTRKSGIYGMLGGQVVDVKSTGNDVTQEVLEFIFELKTGALIEASMMIGAVLAGANEKEVKDIEKIARNIGVAFQIQDDILDITSSTEVLGKPVHSDEKNEKTTYVTLNGLEESKVAVKELSEEAVLLLRQHGKDSDFVESLIETLINREK
ncbi:MAG: farnesyl diphosphate synthase [Eubacteriales bacterium]